MSHFAAFFLQLCRTLARQLPCPLPLFCTAPVQYIQWGAQWDILLSPWLKLAKCGFPQQKLLLWGTSYSTLIDWACSLLCKVYKITFGGHPHSPSQKMRNSCFIGSLQKKSQEQYTRLRIWPSPVVCTDGLHRGEESRADKVKQVAFLRQVFF